MTFRVVCIKCFRGLITLWFIATFVFVVLRISGDPAALMLPDDAPPDVVEHYRVLWGLDAPLAEQYVRYVASVLQGDFGISFREGRPALDVVLERVPATLQLGSVSLIFAAALGIPAGILAAFARNTPLDRIITAGSVAGYSMPNFFLGILLIMMFSLHLRLLPSAGYGGIAFMIMPALTLGTSTMGVLARFTRSSVLDVLGQPYVLAARAKGVPLLRNVICHIMPNAAIPVVTMLGLQAGAIIGGALVTETVFAWPGIGRLLVISVSIRDLAVVQTVVLIVGASMVLVNLAVDLLYARLDPRLS
ncbi:ABC transporter permease [Deltaproteobacteria bacterium]|nr:ABC transporter permease [Deltaproteobacteria bacterium]